MITDAEFLESVYLALLKHPLDAWRAENQRLYCDVRNELADCLGVSAEEVQETYEDMAAEFISAQHRGATAQRML